MLQDRIETVAQQLYHFVLEKYGVELSDLKTETPPRIEFGDLAFPFPFQLAKSLRRAPIQIAKEIVETIGPVKGVSRLEAAGAGFINVFFDRPSFVQELYSWLKRPDPDPSGEKYIVEHTNINPNKAAHIGHLRNAILGDTFIRLLKSLGHRVEVQNYIDNTGVQVADVVVGFCVLRKMSLSDIEQIPEPFDYYCWDLYAEVSEWYSGDKTRTEYRQKVLAAIEAGEGEFFAVAAHVSDRIVRAHLQTMDRIGVRYDVLPRESEILHLKFWDEAFQLLKAQGAIQFSTSGKTEGCWIMPLGNSGEQSDEDKIIVRSNGTVTYVGKDIAYQLWKFGLLGKTFHYQPFQKYPDGSTIWVTCDTKKQETEPEYGSGQRVYNVIDVRQSYLQRVVTEGLRSLGYHDQADRSIHFSYEMVALSPRCCQELNIELSEEDSKRSYVEVSGRKGLGVKADDLINKLIEDSLVEVNERQKELSLEKREAIARQIAVGALRYFMLKYTRNSVIAFDFDEALSFEGETGPYLQYSVVRSNNIFRKIAGRYEDWDEDSWDASLESSVWLSSEASFLLEDNEIWKLLLDVARTSDAVQLAVESLELSGVARHAFTIAQQFNLFYHKHHIISEENETKRSFYLGVTDTSRRGLVKLLTLLGIEVPERM